MVHNLPGIVLACILLVCLFNTYAEKKDDDNDY